MSAPFDPQSLSVDDNASAVGRPAADGIDRHVVTFEQPIEDVDRPTLVSSSTERTCSLGEFYCNVYTFPLRRSALWRWLLLAAGLAPALSLPESIGDHAGLFDVGGLAALSLGSLAALSLAVCVPWSVAYGSALFFAVAEGTAGGANTIDEWPGEDWPEWIERFIHLCYGLGVTGVMSFVVMKAIVDSTASNWPSFDLSHLKSDSPAFWMTTWSLVYILFPVVLMSTMQSPVRAPLTWLVLRSLVAKETAWLWLLFWLAGLPLIALVYGQIAYARHGWFALTGAGLGMLLAAEWMIYARLLGRLGWEIRERLPSEPASMEDMPADESDENEVEGDPESAIDATFTEGSTAKGPGEVATPDEL